MTRPFVIDRGPIVTMPGKMGDLLLSMAVAKRLAEDAGPVLVVTSQMCAPAAPLLRTLPYVRGVVILSEAAYRVEHTHFGAQPWEMPVLTSSPADTVFHLGFRAFPRAGQLVTHLAGEPYGIVPAPGPWLPRIDVDPAGPVALHANAGCVEQVRRMARDVGGERFRLIGTASEWEGYIAPDGVSEEIVRVSNFLDIHQALNGCSRFVGVNSGPSIVAMGGGMPVVWPHRPSVEEERWAHEGCDVRTVDSAGVMRVLREAA